MKRIFFSRPIFNMCTERTQEGYIKKVAGAFWDKIKINTEVISVTTETFDEGKRL
jgi:hypothetical protein